MTDRAVSQIAASLTEAQQKSLRSFGPEPRQMGIGMMQWLPGMVEPVGMTHPLFGPHYRLNSVGEAVKHHLQKEQGDEHSN